MNRRHALRCIPIWTALLLSLAAALAAEEKPAAKPLPDEDCFACHSDPSLYKDDHGKQISLAVDEKAFHASVHAGLACGDCHQDVTSSPHEPPAKVNCGACHEDTQTSYSHSVHAVVRANGENHKTATCLDCHGKIHEVLPSSDPASRTHRTNIPTTCGGCHGVKFVLEGSGVSDQPFFSYQESVHGKAVAGGSEKAAVCTDCHGAHDIRRAGDASSSIFKFNVPSTCGRCHENVSSEYKKSIHGTAVARGNWQAPICTDCHGIHAIKAHLDPNSSVSAQALAKTTCAQCHEGARLSQEFGVSGRRASTYMDSYHGMASKLGSAVVANCASCHGVHEILPSDDPHSTINKANLAETCGKCHIGAGPNFVRGKIHLDVAMAGEKDTGTLIIQWVRRFYLVAIFATIGGMLLHNWLVWRRKAAEHRKHVREIVRMDLNQRWQHFTLLSSFTVLVLTGFALRYPDSWLALLMGSSESVRRIGHRAAAVVMIGVGIYHLGYIAFTGKGRRLVRDLLPILKDAWDVVANLRYQLGFVRGRPAFGRFTYGEKMEYWAVAWGTIVMGVSGLMMWFKFGAVMWLPRWAVDVATAIHWYEAVLATLAILVWHVYHVVFDPDVYPMNWAWRDGMVAEEHYAEEHPLDLSDAIARSLPASAKAEPVETRAAEAPAGHEERGETKGDSAGENAEIEEKETAHR